MVSELQAHLRRLRELEAGGSVSFVGPVQGARENFTPPVETTDKTDETTAVAEDGGREGSRPPIDKTDKTDETTLGFGGSVSFVSPSVGISENFTHPTAAAKFIDSCGANRQNRQNPSAAALDRRWS